MALSFDATAEEYDLAQAIGERAVRTMPEWAAERSCCRRTTESEEAQNGKH